MTYANWACLIMSQMLMLVAGCHLEEKKILPAILGIVFAIALLVGAFK